VVGRHGEVLARHAIWRWPSRIGRGYDMDVILDDAFVASAHVEIRETPEGRYAIEDLRSLNGMRVLPSSARKSSAEIGPEDIVRIGHTQFRVRPRSYAVVGERTIRQGVAYRGSLMFSIALVLVLAMFVWDAFLTASHRDEKALTALSVLMVVAAGAMWIAIWSLVSRTAGRRANFAAHGFVACAGVLALQVWTTGMGYLAFGLDAGWLETLSLVGGAALLGYVVYRHLRLASRAKRQAHATVAACIAIVTFGGGSLLMNLMGAMDPARQSHSYSLKAPFFLVVRGISPAEYIAHSRDLKHAVDDLAARR
jgi:hypothetical protein